ncbi:adenylyl-sulfate kinase, partial [bacterium]|nr:adenylyl-sulfate kinase [bacterium]
MQKGFTLWLTGLTGSGKTTLANEVEGLLLERGVPVEVLDDEEVRLRLYPELGYAKEDRDLNVERLAYLARILSRNGVVAIVAAVSPYHDARRQARQSTERFVEVYCKCPVDVLRKRDMKKIYARAD